MTDSPDLSVTADDSGKLVAAYVRVRHGDVAKTEEFCEGGFSFFLAFS